MLTLTAQLVHLSKLQDCDLGNNGGRSQPWLWQIDALTKYAGCHIYTGIKKLLCSRLLKQPSPITPQLSNGSLVAVSWQSRAYTMKVSKASQTCTVMESDWMEDSGVDSCNNKDDALPA